MKNILKGKSRLWAKGWKTILCSLGIFSGFATAEPYMAVRTGFKCSQCHVNSTGGGKRTDFGNIFSQFILPKPALEEDSLKVAFDPKLNEAISIGANFRVDQLRTMEYEKGASRRASTDGLVIRESNLYVNIDLVKNYLSVYLDETMTPSAQNREFWGKVHLPWNSYFKMGRMLLPYGYRLMDDQAFVRTYSGYTYNTHDLGYEVGTEPGPFSLIMNVTNTQFSSVGSVILPSIPFVNNFRLGGAYSSGIKKLEQSKNENYGVFAGFSSGWFTFLGERDWIKRDLTYSIAHYAEMDILPWQGYNFKFTYEHYWPDADISVKHSAMTRMSAGFEPFLWPYMQFGLYYRKNDWIPQNLAGNQDEIIGRFHVFF
jgi:hypothetical protein